MARRAVAATLPDFPWDSLTAAKEKASAHPDGIVNLSVGTPVDPVAEVIRVALNSVADEPGYPTTVGTVALREAANSIRRTINLEWTTVRVRQPDHLARTGPMRTRDHCVSQ